MEDLQEVSFGAQEGAADGGWFDDWVAGTVHAGGRRELRRPSRPRRGRRQPRLERPAPVLVVAHGALFRALREEMGLPANVRTANACRCSASRAQQPGAPWTLTPASG